MSIRLRRGTRAAINAARQAGTLLFGELFIGTDDNKPGVAIAGNAYREIPLLGTDGKLPAIDGSNLLNLPIPDLVGIGIGQTWQSVTRTTGTSYQNTTGRPIAVAARVSQPSSAQMTVRVDISTDNAAWYAAAAGFMGGNTGHMGGATAIVPDGIYYRVVVFGGVTPTLAVLELR